MDQVHYEVVINNVKNSTREISVAREKKYNEYDDF